MCDLSIDSAQLRAFFPLELTGFQHQYFDLKEHASFRWVTKEELPLLDWAAADVGIVEELLPMVAEEGGESENQ